jgi:trehalose 6-phosphate phosphatase
LLPPASVDKGTALLRLLELTQVEAALYVGDDDTDEDVFALHEPALLSIRIGRSEQSRARLYLRAPQEIPRLVDLVFKTQQPAALPAHGPRGASQGEVAPGVARASHRRGAH